MNCRETAFPLSKNCSLSLAAVSQLDLCLVGHEIKHNWTVLMCSTIIMKFKL